MSRSPRVYQPTTLWMGSLSSQFPRPQTKNSLSHGPGRLDVMSIIRTQLGGRQHGGGQSPLAVLNSSLTIKPSNSTYMSLSSTKLTDANHTRYQSNDQHSTTSEKRIETVKTHKTRYRTARVWLTPKRTHQLGQGTVGFDTVLRITTVPSVKSLRSRVFVLSC